MGFGSLFSSKTSVENKTLQSDERVFQETGAENVGSRSSGTGSITAGGQSRAGVAYGTNNTVLIEDLNADLAAQAIAEVSKRTSGALDSALGFTQTALDKVFKNNEEARTQAFNALDETRDFAANLISKNTETADDRLQNFGLWAFGGIAVLAGLLIWKG